MVGDERRRRLERVEVQAGERLDDDLAGVLLVLAFDLVGVNARVTNTGQLNDRHALSRDTVSRDMLAPTRSQTANACERRRRSARTPGTGRDPSAYRTKAGLSIDDGAALQIDDHHRLRHEFLVGHPARLDRHHPGRAIGGAGIAEREDDKPRADDLAVRLEDALAQPVERRAHRGHLQPSRKVEIHLVPP